MTQYASEVEDDVPFDVNGEDADVEVGDLSAVADSDVIDTCRRVTFEIKKATLDTQEYKLDDEGHLKKWAKVSLKLQLNVGPQGTDGEGRYANKAFFTNLLLKVNKADFPDAFQYDKFGPNGKAFRPIKQFWVAMGGDPRAVSVTRDWRDLLVGMSVVADIVKSNKRVQVNGEWVDGEPQNTIENFRKVEVE